MRLQVRKGTVDGYEWRCRNQSKDNRHDVVRSGQFDSYHAEYMWRRSNGHKLVDENFHKFLASIARVYAPTDHDEMQAWRGHREERKDGGEGEKREFLNTIIEERERKEEIELDERKRKEEIELDERKRKEEIELNERKRKEERKLAERKRKEEIKLAERKRKEEMEIAERKRRADFEQRMRDVEMEFETQKKLIELEGEGHLARACLDIEVSTDRGNIGNEVRSNLSSETRLKVEVEDRLKDDEEAKSSGGRAEDGRRKKNERNNSFGRRNEIKK
ncbi:hypothetical protein TNCV_4425011 [Trichonephila clavipes]|nr:hypothetical protein TNCV_4425011 [Trichonephila clavipes]